MNVNIRKFKLEDIPDKVRWINDPLINVFLHYDLPLEFDKTTTWFQNNRNRTDRYDAIIEVDSVPVGIIGLLSIDHKHRKAEYYITIGERKYLKKGVAFTATRILLNYAFSELGLNRVYLYTETENIAAAKSFERIGFRREGVLKNDLFSKGRFVDRYIYAITKNDFYHGIVSPEQQLDTPIQRVSMIEQNQLYFKREDLIPFSFGGNKARKAKLFFEEIDRGKYDCVVTYGTSSSNHCRVIANMAASRNLPCYIISPEEASDRTYNSDLMQNFGAEFTFCPVDQVRSTIEKQLVEISMQNRNPYFIAGGGHGNIGTQAYVSCYEEIRRFEKENSIHFDYIFLASGTGTTQAGLICGQLIHRDDRQIVGISIARRNPYGRDVIIESIHNYLNSQKVDILAEAIEQATIFEDGYVDGGYGSQSENIDAAISESMIRYGIPLDSTYTGKAYAGMLEYIKKTSITGANILFIHTGGTPLFFDHLHKKMR